MRRVEGQRPFLRSIHLNLLFRPFANSSLSSCLLFTGRGFFTHYISVHRKANWLDDPDVSFRPPNLGAEPSPNLLDPFASLPSSTGLTRRDHELVRFFLRVSPGAVYGERPPEAYRYNWVRDICFKGAMTSSLTLYTMITSFSANHQAWLRGKKDDPLSIYYQSRAVSMIREHLRRNPGDTSDEIIGSIISQA